MEFLLQVKVLGLRKRSPYDYSKVIEDRCNDFLLHLISWKRVIILSWREDSCRKQTEEWLDKYGVKYENLFMRKTWDKRKDSIVKKEIYEEKIKDKYNIVWVFDDRQQVVDMWRLELKLPTYQVWYCNF